MRLPTIAGIELHNFEVKFKENYVYFGVLPII